MATNFDLKAREAFEAARIEANTVLAEALAALPFDDLLGKLDALLAGAAPRDSTFIMQAESQAYILHDVLTQQKTMLLAAIPPKQVAASPVLPAMASAI
jgi:hypothetical protein